MANLNQKQTRETVSFSESYLGRLRQVIGSRLVLMPGARIVIENQQGKILIEKRADFKKWGLPGGTAEEGASIEETIIREVREETGLEISNPQVFGFSSDPQIETMNYPNGDTLHGFTLLFYCREFEGNPTISPEENEQLEWVDPEDLPDMLLNMRKTTEAYLAFKETNLFQLI